MQQGYYKQQTYEYTTEDGTKLKCGLVYWKDRDIVYALTNCVNTIEKGMCYRRSSQGRLCIERPNVIQVYNKKHGWCRRS